MSSRVFVYGTLRPGESRWPLLSPYAAGEPVEATTPGLLFDTHRGWPAAVFDVGTTRMVPGVVVPLDPDVEPGALTELDEVEGVGDGLFERRVIRVEGITCWAYHWPSATTGFTMIDAWPVGA